MNIQKLIDLDTIGLSNIKVHLASGKFNRRDALNEYYKGTFQQWQEWQTHKNFGRNYILSLAQITNEEWLFIGIYQRLDVRQDTDGYHYLTKLTEIGDEFRGRLKILFKKDFRQSYILAEKYIDKFEVTEFLREKMVMDEFPGYENVHIDYRTLQTIIRVQEKSWRTALSSISGIYLISDANNGKLYVGSATGNDNFWQRWSDYAKNFHGGNEELKKIKKSKDASYFDNIFYSILEIYSNKVDSQYILGREYFWQKILKTKEFGYNNGKKI